MSDQTRPEISTGDPTTLVCSDTRHLWTTTAVPVRVGRACQCGAKVLVESVCGECARPYVIAVDAGG